jgi:hypothetical protein
MSGMGWSSSDPAIPGLGVLENYILKGRIEQGFSGQYRSHRTGGLQQDRKYKKRIKMGAPLLGERPSLL